MREDKYADSDLLPHDPKVKTGRLENGLTYYIRANAKPAERVELRLAVNAGSILEEDNEQGLAHFVEHMCFKGTENFPKNQIIKSMQDIGVEFGADLNAYTGFDRTVYILPIPNIHLRKGLDILCEWANKVTMEQQAIDSERGVILEELRIGQGAEQRMRERWFPKVFKNSKYADRLPIGKKDIIEHFTPETLRNFYKKWYRPDLQALIITGDIDPMQTEAMVIEIFSKTKGIQNPSHRAYFPVESHKETIIAVESDKESPYTVVQLMYKAERQAVKTVGDYKASIKRRLYNSMVSFRFEELTQQAEPPFMYAASNYLHLVDTKDCYCLFAVTGPAGAEKGLKNILIENERIRRHGFRETELERAKKELLNELKKRFNERDKTESAQFTDEYINLFLHGDASPGIEFEYCFVKNYLGEVRLDDLNSQIKYLIKDNDRVLLITGPEKPKITYPSEKDILELVKQVENSLIEPYHDHVCDENLIEILPKAGKIVKTNLNEAVGIEKITLSNGIEVILKPTTFKDDEVLFSAYRKGGRSQHSQQDDISISLTTKLVEESGLGKFSKMDLQKKLSGRNLRLTPAIESYQETFSGSSSVEDLETLFELIHLHFTSPRFDREALTSLLNKEKMILSTIFENPQTFYQDEITRIMTSGHPRADCLAHVEDLEKVDFDTIKRIFFNNFGNPAEFTFFFVGSFESEKIKKMAAKYLGSLNAQVSDSGFFDMGIRPPHGAVDKKIHRGVDNKSTVSLFFDTKHPFDEELSINLISLGEILKIRLLDILRGEMSGVYGLRVNTTFTRIPYEHSQLRISFPCSVENYDLLTEAVLKELRNIIKNGVPQELLSKVIETRKKNLKEAFDRNNFWIAYVQKMDLYNEDFTGICSLFDELKTITPESIQRSAKELIHPDDYIRITLLPEQK